MELVLLITNGLVPNAKMRIGRHNTNSTNTYYSKMTIAEIQLVDGQTLNATDFGEFYNGVWVPKQYTGTYGNCGFYLDFADSSDLGKDVSGNGNHFTSSNLQTNHQLEDTPTNSFPHLDMMPAETDRTNITGRSRIWAGCRYNYKNGKYDITNYWKVVLGVENSIG